MREDAPCPCKIAHGHSARQYLIRETKFSAADSDALNLSFIPADREMGKDLPKEKTGCVAGCGGRR